MVPYHVSTMRQKRTPHFSSTVNSPQKHLSLLNLPLLSPSPRPSSHSNSSCLRFRTPGPTKPQGRDGMRDPVDSSSLGVRRRSYDSKVPVGRVNLGPCVRVPNVVTRDRETTTCKRTGASRPHTSWIVTKRIHTRVGKRGRGRRHRLGQPE